MSLHPEPLPPVPEDTARIARAAFRRGNAYVLLRDRLGAVFADADFADLYPRRGQPAYAPWRLALVTLMQCREGLSDRRAADAVRGRIDWKYLLALDLDDAGFDFSVLCEFRARLLEHGAAERLLDRLLDAAREGGLLKARGRSRTDSTHVLAAVRVVNRLELLAETMRAALGAIAAAAPDWLREVASPEWHERYDRRVEDFHLPATPTKREAYAAQVGADGFRLLDALDGAGAPESMRELPAVLVMRRVWARHYERGGRCSEDDVAGGNHDDTSSRVRLCPIRGRGPGDHPDDHPNDRIESPYDSEARFRTKGSMGWVGYMVHLTETCDAARPRLIVRARAMPANTHEAGRTGAIHDALAAKGMAPSEHLVDSGYVSGAHIVAARERHGVDLVGPPRPDLSWQAREGSAFVADDFVVDWENHRVRCPEGRTSTTWGACTDKTSGRSYVRAGFSPKDCRPCVSRSRCTRARSRRLLLMPRPEHEAVAAARARMKTEDGRRLYDQRRGIEGTISQGVRAFGMRRARYRGLPKMNLQSVIASAAIDLDRLAAWFADRPIAQTRTSRFAALAV